MYIAIDIFCFAVPLKILFSTILSVAAGVDGCWWNISTAADLMDVALWKFSNNPPSSTYLSDTVTFLIMLHSTCTGTFCGIPCIFKLLEVAP